MCSTNRKTGNYLKHLVQFNTKLLLNVDATLNELPGTLEAVVKDFKQISQWIYYISIT